MSGSTQAGRKGDGAPKPSAHTGSNAISSNGIGVWKPLDFLWLPAFVPIALAFIGSQSLSKVPVGPVFIYDVAIILSLISGSALLSFRGNWRPWKSLSSIIPLLALPLWAVARFLWSDFSWNAMRELHPFLVLSYSVFLAVMISRLCHRSKILGYWLLIACLFFFWGLLTVRLGDGFLGLDPLSGGPESLLSVYPQVDGILLGLLASLSLLRSLQHSALATTAVGIFVVVVHLQIGSLGNRGAHLAAVVMLLVTVVYALLVDRKKVRKTRVRKVQLSLAIMIFIVASIGPLFTSEIGQRYAGAIDQLYGSVSVERLDKDTAPGLQPKVSEQPALGSMDRDSVESARETDARSGGAGTVRARLNAWSTLGQWLSSQPERLWLGAGMGSTYWVDSGTKDALLGSGVGRPGVGGWPYNWPHNFIMSTWAVLGLPAALFLVGVTTWGFAKLVRNARAEEPINELAMLLLPGLITASLFGVIFENPFGSLLYAWCLGIAFQPRPLGERQSRFD